MLIPNSQVNEHGGQGFYSWIPTVNQSHWHRGLKLGAADACLLGLRVRIPPEVWMSVSCEWCVLPGRGPSEWGVIEYGSKASIMRRPWSTRIFFFHLAQWHPVARAFLLSTFLDHTQPRTTVGRIPLDEQSARRRDLYVTTYNIHKIKHPGPGWNSNPQYQQASGRRPTPEKNTCLIHFISVFV
jgi:hypothetical protein